MQKISSRKQMGIVRLYLQGFSYDDIVTHTASRAASLLLAFITAFPTPPFPPRPLSVRRPVVVGVRRRGDPARVF